MFGQWVTRLIFGSGLRPTALLYRLPCRRVAARMGNDGQRFPVVDRKRRHIVIVELLVLIIAENHDDIGLGVFEHISQRLERFLTGFIALSKFLRLYFT